MMESAVLRGKRRRVSVDRHSTVDRTPETVLEHWYTPLKLNGQLLPPPPPETKSEAEKFLAWLKARRSYSGNTLHWYMVAFRQLCCLAAVKLKKSPRELTYEDYLELRPKYPEPVRLYFRFLWEVTGDERYKRVYERIRAPQKKKRLPEALSREQVEKLLEECGREDPELKVLVALIYETGARAGEILRLKARDIEFDEYGARIWIRKSKSEARVLRVALYAQLLAAWMETRKPQPEEPIFTRNVSRTSLQEGSTPCSAGTPSASAAPPSSPPRPSQPRGRLARRRPS
jgi:integrase